jgi:hypothetical protein
VSAPDNRPERVDNGLRALTYVPLTDVDPDTGQQLLTALGRARIAAYLMPGGAADTVRTRLFVAAEERVDARTIVAATVRALGADDPHAGDAAVPADPQDATSPAGPAPQHQDPLAGLDTDAAFQALIADWHVDTHEAIRQAERDLRREDAEWRARLARPPAEDPVWLDEDHYIPPPPPPLPKLATPTIAALTVLVISILVLGLGGEIGLANQLCLVLGIGGLLLGGAILFSRIRERRRDDEDGDDGAAI